MSVYHNVTLTVENLAQNHQGMVKSRRDNDQSNYPLIYDREKNCTSAIDDHSPISVGRFVS